MGTHQNIVEHGSELIVGRHWGQLRGCCGGRHRCTPFHDWRRVQTRGAATWDTSRRREKAGCKKQQHSLKHFRPFKKENTNFPRIRWKIPSSLWGCIEGKVVWTFEHINFQRGYNKTIRVKWMSGTCNDEMQMRMNEEVNVNLKETRTVQQKNYSRYAERTEKGDI